jgi:hypothetical protein
VYSVPSVVAFLWLPLPLCTAILKSFVFLTRFVAAKERVTDTEIRAYVVFSLRSLRSLWPIDSWLRLCPAGPSVVAFHWSRLAALRSLRPNPPHAVRFRNKKLVIPSKRAIMPMCEHCSLT